MFQKIEAISLMQSPLWLPFIANKCQLFIDYAQVYLNTSYVRESFNSNLT